MYLDIVSHIYEELEKYREGNHPYPFGGFLTAILANDLVGAASRADDYNREHLYDYADYLYNRLPRGMWGSYEIVANNIKQQMEAHNGK